MRIGLPIRYKFLLATTVLLVACVVSFLSLAANIFKRDKIELVFDLNRSAVTGLASDVEAVFRGVSDKMKLVAVLSQDTSSKAILQDLLRNDSNIVFMAASYGLRQADQTLFIADDFASTYGLEERYYSETLPQTRPIPFDEIRSKGEAVWNATIKDGPPLIGYGRSVVPESSDGSEAVPFVIISFVRGDRLLKSFAHSKLNEVTVVNQHGQILLHPKQEVMIKAGSIAKHPLFQQAISQPVRTGVSSFTSQGRSRLGAYSTSADRSILVLSQVDEGLAFSAVQRLIEQSLIFAGIAITLAFLAAVLFSRSLTRPIQALVDAMKRVSEGELSTRIDVRTNDEISVLASSFNSMIGDLKASREQLEEANRDLEQKVRDRTRKLEEQNQAVKRAQEALLQSTRLAAVGEVAGRAAHEVLNPLTSIVTRLERVKTRLMQGPAQEVTLVQDILTGWESDVKQGGFDRLVENWRTPSSVESSMSLWEEDFDNVKHFEGVVSREVNELLSDTDFLLKESQRINKIVQSMRSLTRVKGDLQVLSAGEVMKEAIDVMADLCQANDIQIDLDVSTDKTRIRVDRDEFIQVATNLIRNSIQAIQERGAGSADTPTVEPGKIQIRVSGEDERVQIDIEDNGVGIAPVDQAKLFEIQFSTKSADEGTGLGLTICRRFVRAFGGDIALVRSAPGEGCVFRIELPLTELTETNGTNGTEKVAA